MEKEKLVEDEPKQDGGDAGGRWKHPQLVNSVPSLGDSCIFPKFGALAVQQLQVMLSAMSGWLGDAFPSRRMMNWPWILMTLSSPIGQWHIPGHEAVSPLL